MVSNYIWRRIAGWILINFSPSNKLHFSEKYRQNSQAVLGTTGMNGLDYVVPGNIKTRKKKYKWQPRNLG